MDKQYEDLLERMSHADTLFKHLLREGHTSTGELADLARTAERLKWKRDRIFDAALHLHGRQWIEAVPSNAFERRTWAELAQNGKPPAPLLVRLSLAGSEQAVREMNARTQSHELARMNSDVRRAQRWTALFMILLGVSVILNVFLLLAHS